MLKIIKEDIEIVILVIVLIIGALFLGYKSYQHHQWWNSLSPKEQQQITLTNERNYSYDYLDGIITDIDDIYYWSGTPCYKTEAEIYCAGIDETFDYKERICQERLNYMNNKETKIRNRKHKITVIVALIMAVSCSWAAMQSMYYAIWMIAIDVTGNAYDIPSFGSMPQFLIGASMILFATAAFLLKNIIELIHTTKRSAIEGDKN